MRTAAIARSAATGARPDRSMPLSRPPAMSTTGASKARSAATTASGWVPCESLTKRTPSTSATGSSRCSTPRKAAAAARIAAGSSPKASADRDRRQRVRHVVRARDGQLGGRHDPRGRGRRGRHPPGRGARPVGDDPAVDHPEPAGQRRVAAVRDRRAPADGRVRRDDRVLDVEHERAVGIDQLGEPALDPAIALERPVPVEVVRGDIGVDRHGRAARQGRQLQLGQLVDDAMVGRQLEQALDDRQADVAAEDDRVRRVGGEDGRGQRGRRGLALRAGHSDRRRRAQPQEEVRLRHERRDAPGCPRSRASTSAREGGPQTRLGRREVGCDRRRGGHQVGRRPGRPRVDVRTRVPGSPSVPERARSRRARSSAGRPS